MCIRDRYMGYFQTKLRRASYVFSSKNNLQPTFSRKLHPVNSIPHLGARQRNGLMRLNAHHPRFLRREYNTKDENPFKLDRTCEVAQPCCTPMNEQELDAANKRYSVGRQYECSFLNARISSTRNVVLKIIKEDQKTSEEQLNSGLLTNSTDLKSIIRRINQSNNSVKNSYYDLRNSSKLRLKSKKIGEMNKSVKEDLKGRFSIILSKGTHKFMNTEQAQPKLATKSDDDFAVM
eukprot:TRINITY_DN3019_c0_g1_i6.p1 TRINITY_DN3019_c0_g1~~TRINITY_DN3019_c0_g1_i6.p1  ORF type:complete len:255 (+),score=69.62 TRINITY_DN3019_c0_g1_i6:65-766(+)